jgi:predicted transcriptional regulator
MSGRVTHSAGRIDASPDRSIRKSARRVAVDFNAGIRAALAEVGDGAVVPAEAVEKWIESWDTADELPMPKPANR